MRGKRVVIVAVVALIVAVGGYLGAAAVVLDVALTPRRVKCAVPTDLGVPVEAATLSSTTDGTKIAAWVAAPGREKGVVMIHGLDSCGWHGAAPMVARRYLEAGFSVGVLDLRAQGDSEGEGIGLGWLERGDVEALVRALQAKGSTKIGIHGSSYGAATALLSTAAIADVKAVVADSAFADIRDLMDAELRRKVGGVAGAMAPGVVLVAKVVHGLDLEAIAPIDAAKAIGPRPISLLHGALDDRIPVEHVRRLHAATGGAAQLWILESGGHTVAHELAREEYFARTVDFLASRL